MEYKPHNFIPKRFVSMILIVAIFLSSFMPVFAPRTHAFLGIGDFGVTIDVKALLRSVVDGAAMTLAQRMVDEIVKSTVRWANTGFEGNPAYVTDPGRYFTDLADGVAGEFIENSPELGFLCSPFQNNIRLSLASYYYEPPETRFQCTVSGIEGNIEDYFNSFHNGGWEAWFSMTQNPTNNPYGAYLTAKAELDYRIANALDLEKESLSWNQGFRDWAPCIKEEEGTGKCLERDETRTPGAIIKSQLDEVLPSGLEKLISVEHVEQLVGAFAAGLLNRYVFGSGGLFGDNHEDHLQVSNDPEDIPEPDIEEFVTTLPGYEGGANTGGNANNGGSNPYNNPVSCYADRQFASIGLPVTWSASSNLSNTDFIWQLDDVSAILGETEDTITVEYGSGGNKFGLVRAYVDGEVVASANCNNPVIITDEE